MNKININTNMIRKSKQQTEHSDANRTYTKDLTAKPEDAIARPVRRSGHVQGSHEQSREPTMESSYGPGVRFISQEQHMDSDVLTARPQSNQVKVDLQKKDRS